MQVSILKSKVREHRVERKADESHPKAENGDVSNVLKELLPSHVEARVQDDGRKQEVKEDVLIELVDLGA